MLSIGVLLIILIIAWSVSNVYKDGFTTCNTQSTGVLNDFNIYTLECKPNQYLSQLKRQQDGTNKKYSYKCCTDSSGNMQGVRGEQGEQGIQPKQAIDGAKGPEGEQGPQGEKGPRGPQGKQGLEGIKKGVGARGPQGKQGQIGAQGARGEDGIIESNGPVENPIIGPKGKTGPVGPKGEIGPRGTDAPGSKEQARRKAERIGGKDKLEKIQLYLINALSKERPPPPTSKLKIYREDEEDDEGEEEEDDEMYEATTLIDTDVDEEVDIIEYFTTSCAQGKEYRSNTYKRSSF